MRLGHFVRYTRGTGFLHFTAKLQSEVAEHCGTLRRILKGLRDLLRSHEFPQEFQPSCAAVHVEHSHRCRYFKAPKCLESHRLEAENAEMCLQNTSEYMPDSSRACFPPGIQVWSSTETSEILDLGNDVSTALSAIEVQAGHRQRTRTGTVFSPIEVRVLTFFDVSFGCFFALRVAWCADYGSEAGGPSGLRQEMRLQCSRVNPSRRVESQRNFTNCFENFLRCDARCKSAFSDVSHQAKPRSAKKVHRSRYVTPEQFAVMRQKSM